MRQREGIAKKILYQKSNFVIHGINKIVETREQFSSTSRTTLSLRNCERLIACQRRVLRGVTQSSSQRRYAVVAVSDVIMTYQDHVMKVVDVEVGCPTANGDVTSRDNL